MSPSGGRCRVWFSFWELALSNMMIKKIIWGSSGMLEMRNGKRSDFE
jgi:hypothetical protein